ncbi:DUF4248 domain-containing protein [Bacteroides sp.]
MKDEKKENQMWDDREYPIRVYTKAELAMLYNPASCIMVALNTLSRWIRMNGPLMKELEAIGYNKFRHSFTPREVELIFKYIGEPGM